MRNVLNTLSVFETIARSQPLALPGVVARVGLPTTTTHRAIKTLADAGWVVQEADGTKRWTVADHVVRLVTTGEHPLHAAAAPVCAELRDLCGESVVISIPDDDQVVVIGHWDGTGMLRVVQAVGTRAPMVLSSTGRSYLSHLDDAQRADIITRFNESHDSPIDAAEIELAVQQARGRGYAVVDNPWFEGVTQIGAAIVHGGTAVGGVGLAIPSHRVQPDLVEGLGARLRTAATAIADRLSNSGPMSPQPEDRTAQ